MLYLMQPSDPIVWAIPNLILGEPDWVGETPGSDVLDQMVGIPVVTFWQVSAELPFSTGGRAARDPRRRLSTSTAGAPCCDRPASAGSRSPINDVIRALG